MNKVLRRQKLTKKYSSRFLIYLILFLFVFIFAFPFYYVFVLSSLDDSEIFTSPPRLFFGTHILENWRILFEQINFGRNFLNSVGIATLSTLFTIFFCTLGGYAFAKYSFKGKKILFTFVLTTLAIPPFLNIIPFFRMMVAFGWYNTWLPLIVPGVANAFGIFLMTQFIGRAVPDEMLEAARIDGFGELGILFRIVFPLAAPGISVLGTITFIGSWNNFLGALILLPKIERTTIPVALSSLRSQSGGGFGAIYIGTALALLPLIIVFLSFSKKIINDFARGSIKG